MLCPQTITSDFHLRSLRHYQKKLFWRSTRCHFFVSFWMCSSQYPFRSVPSVRSWRSAWFPWHEEFARVQVLHPFYNENEIWGPRIVSSLMVIAFLLFTNTNLSTLLELPSSVNRCLISWLCLKLCADYPCHLDRASKTCHILLKYHPIVSTSKIPSPTHLQFVFPSCSTPEHDSVEFLSGSIIVSLERADPRNTEISRIRFWVSICQEKQFKYHWSDLTAWSRFLLSHLVRICFHKVLHTCFVNSTSCHLLRRSRSKKSLKFLMHPCLDVSSWGHHNSTVSCESSFGHGLPYST